MRGIENAFECACAWPFYFHFGDSRLHLYYGAAVLTTHLTRLDVCQWCSGSTNHSPSSYSVAGKWNCMYCNVTGYLSLTIRPFSGSVERVICFPCFFQYTQSGIFVVCTELLFDIVLSCKSTAFAWESVFFCCLWQLLCAYASPPHQHRKHEEYLDKYSRTTYSIFYE